MNKILTLLSFLALLPFMATAEGAVEKGGLDNEIWRPDKPINLIVPWEAGGLTDRSARVAAEILEEYLGQRIVIVNLPGAAGSAGTKIAMDAPRDGYTWTAGAARNLGTYKLQGLLDTTIDDWHLFLTVAVPMVVAVPADSPYESFDQLLAAFRANPEQIKVATAGINSAGHTAMEQIRKYTGISYSHVACERGNSAVITTLTGKADVVLQLSIEEAGMLRAGKLRALTVLSTGSLELEGYGTIEPVTRWIPRIRPALIYYGLFIPKGVPDNIIATLGNLWDEKVKGSSIMRRFTAENGLIFDPEWGVDAQELAFPMIQLEAWRRYEAGQSVISPRTIGIPRFEGE